MEDSIQRDNFQMFYGPVEMPGGYSFNHPEMLRMIDLYYNSKFKTGDRDKKGYKKFFYNIVKPACDIATKFVDLDTKDIMLIPESGDDNEFKVWMMQKKLRQWLKDEDFGSLLNQIAENYPKYGTVVVKKTKTGVKLVNIQNLRMDPAAECLEDSRFAYELMVMDRVEIDKMGWDKTKIKELYDRGEETSFLIYDCYDKTGTGWTRTVKADLFTAKKGGGNNRGSEAEINRPATQFIGAIELFKEELGPDDFKMRELHWERVPGRWLGRGFVEYLEDNQIAMNETENLERKGIHLKALQLWQTRDESIGGSNVFSDAENGDVLRIQSEITPVAKDNSDLAAFGSARQTWGSNTERKTFTTDITTGANLPSRTPLGVANLQASLASSYFDLKRENFGLFIKSLVLFDIIPDFKNESFEEHVLTFSGGDEDLDRLDQTVVKILTDKSVADYAMKTGFYPSQEQKEDLKNRVLATLKSNKHRFAEIPKNFYSDACYILDVNITNESVDNGAKSQVLQLALQIVGTNPAIVQDPVARNILFTILGLGGISPVEIGLMSEQAQQAPQPQLAQAGNASPQVTGSLAKQSPLVSSVGRASQLL